MATEYEYSDTVTNWGMNPYDTAWWSQTFTVGTVGENVSHVVEYVKLNFAKVAGATSGSVTVSIKDVDIYGKPTGADLCSDTYSGSFPDWPATAYYQFDMSGFTAVSGTKYAIVVTAAGVESFLSWGISVPSAYSGGTMLYSDDSGSTWTDYTWYLSGNFQVWGHTNYNSYAYSTSIDYNNGTITQAKATYTHTGIMDMSLTADGGSNWETCNSGALHTFTHTGTDLRWKASGYTAATLTALEINNYH